MTQNTSKLLPVKPRTVWYRVGNIFSILILSIILLGILTAILIQTRPVQNFARIKIVSYLEKKLKTKVQIGKIDIDFPNSILLQNVYFEDQSKDTLLSGGEIRADINMLKILQNEIKIGELEFNGVTARIKRLLPDTVFNFQFIVDAFASDQKKVSTATDTTTLKMNIDNIFVNNTRIYYADVFTGNEMDLVISHLDSKITTFDPARMYFNVPSINVKGLSGYFYQNDPLKSVIQEAVVEAVKTQGTYLQLINGVISLADVNVNYRSVPTGINTQLKFNSLVTHPDTLNMREGKFDLKDVTLTKADIEVIMSDKKAPVVTPVKVTKQEVEEVLSAFTISADKFDIVQSNFKLDNTSMPPTNYGMDYGHMDFKDINITATDVVYNFDTIAAVFKNATLREKSGFVLTNLNADFLFTDKEIALRNLYIKTPGSVIRRNAVLTFPSLAALVKDPSVLYMDLNLESSSVLVKDILTFAPMLRSQPAFANSGQTWMLNGGVKGRMNNLHFADVRVKALTGTTLFASGMITGLPDPKKFNADLNISYFTTTQRDLKSLLPPGTLPANAMLPQTLTAMGKLKASMTDVVTDLTIKTSLGSAKLKGNILNYSNPAKASYDMNVIASALQLGKLSGNQAMLGAVSGNFTVKGTGFDPQTANATVKGNVTSAFINNYNYRNVKLDASIADKAYTLNASIFDPNIHLTLQADGLFDGAYPGLRFTADIDSIKTQPLNLTPQMMVYHGKIRGDLTNLDPDMLSGSFLITNSVLVNEGQRIMLDSVSIFADHSGGRQTIKMRSEFIVAEITGQYKLTQLAAVFQQSLDPYFNLTGVKNSAPVHPYEFVINARLFSHPAIKTFLPDLQRLDSVIILANFSSVNGWNAAVDAPMIITDVFKLGGLKFNAVTKNNQLEFTSSFSQFRLGSQLAVYATDISGSIANNQINFAIGIKDAGGKEKYKLGALFTQPSTGNYSFTLNPLGLMLNYEPWLINADNNISLINEEIVANNFILSNKGQQLKIQSMGVGLNRPLSIDFTNFKIATLAAFVQSDSTLVNGTMNGNLILKNYSTLPVFTADLNIADLSVFRDTVGNVTAKIHNNISNQFNADIAISGRGNDLRATGIYYVKPDNNSSFDFLVDITSMQLKSVEALSMGMMRYSTGSIKGKISLKGTVENPDIEGQLGFNNAGFNITALNSHFKVDGQTIRVDNGGVAFDRLVIKDTSNNEMVLNGRINTSDFFNYEFDLRVIANKFQVMNTTTSDNRLFYGKMVITTSAQIKGTPTNPIVDGAITVNDETRFTVVLPQTEPGVIAREGIVRFVDLDAAPEDSLFLAIYDSLNVATVKGFDITANIEVEKNAEFSMVIDEGNGDFIRIRGEALLTAGIDPSGKVTLVGSYELESGSYEITFNFLKRKFNIEKGSRIVWDGEPTSADIDVTAVYVADAAPYDLVQNQIAGSAREIRNTYLQKLPFEVHLSMRGKLMQPEITFDIILPSERNYGVSQDIVNDVQLKLLQIRQEPSELNKQVFALLLLNRFVAENPFDNSGGSSFDAGTFARQSVSKLLTEQLNALAGGLIQGVDINFDVTTADDFTTGTRRSRTDFNVGLSKRLLNERLTITVGSNFELEGPRRSTQKNQGVAGNVAVDYKLTSDGRFLIRFYRKNEYEGAVEGYVVETGVGFIINVDFNRFNEILKRKKNMDKEAKKTEK